MLSGFMSVAGSLPARIAIFYLDSPLVVAYGEKQAIFETGCFFQEEIFN